MTTRSFFYRPQDEIHEGYFRLDSGLTNSDELDILLLGSVGLTQVVIQCQTSSNLRLSVCLPSGGIYTLAEWTGVTQARLNTASQKIVWEYLPANSKLRVIRTDSGTTDRFEIACTFRSPWGVLSPPHGM